MVIIEEKIMRYETIVEITPDGRPALRLVIVPDDPPAVPPTYEEESGVIIIPPPGDEEDPNVITWDV